MEITKKKYAYKLINFHYFENNGICFNSQKLNYFGILLKSIFPENNTILNSKYANVYINLKSCSDTHEGS